METLLIPSLHSEARNKAIKRVVLHAMAEFPIQDGRPMYCTELLHMLRLSVHAIALPDGRLLSLVPPDRMAFHAMGNNGDTLGIEFAVSGPMSYETFIARIQGTSWPTRAQLESGAAWVASMCRQFKLPVSAVTTHAKLDPTRKKDPGVGFPLEAFLQSVQAAAAPPRPGG